MLSLEQTPYAIALALFLYYILTTIFSHRYPKPLPPGPNPWPIVGNLPHMGSVPHQGLASLARKYGPLLHMKLGSVHVVVAASAAVAAQFLKVHDANFSSRPPNAAAKYVAYNYQDVVFAPYGPRWRMLRKICSLHLFSTKALDDYRFIRQEETSIMRKELARASRTKAVQIGQLLNVCTTNSLSRMMLGKRVFGDGREMEATQFKMMVVELMALAGVFDIADFIPALKWFDVQGVVAKMKKLHYKFDDFIGAILEEHKAIKECSGGGDMLSTLISIQDNCDGDGAKLTDIQIKALLLNLFIAGTDTTSSIIEWALSELIRHPKILAQVQKELDTIVGRDRIVNESDLTHLTYFQAVIKEVFRLHPSTPLSLPRIASQPCEINGYHIPKDTTLLVNIWAIARDPDVWADPLEFRPERFLEGGERPKADVKGNDFELIPFGAGRRICPGINLGILMVRLLTATLAQGFDWELGDGLAHDQLNMDEAHRVFLQRKVPLMVHPRPRLLAHVYETV